MQSCLVHYMLPSCHQTYEGIHKWTVAFSVCVSSAASSSSSKMAAPLILWRSRRTRMPGVPVTVTPGCTCATVSNVYVLLLDDGGANCREKIELKSEVISHRRWADVCTCTAGGRTLSTSWSFCAGQMTFNRSDLVRKLNGKRMFLVKLLIRTTTIVHSHSL